MTTQPLPGKHSPCPHCGQPVYSPHISSITDRAYDSLTRRQYARTRHMTFCSDKCATHFQFGCEG